MSIDQFNWVDAFEGAITLCNNDFTIVYMNERSIQDFAKYGGADLLGKNLLDCHNSNSREKIRSILHSGISHAYTRTLKSGKIKAIKQCPWLEEGKIKGIVEISFYLD